MYSLARRSSISESSAFCHCAAQSSGDDDPSTASACSRCLGEGTRSPGSAGSGLLAARQGDEGGEWRVQIPLSSPRCTHSPKPTLGPAGPLRPFCLNKAEEDLSKSPSFSYTAKQAAGVIVRQVRNGGGICSASEAGRGGDRRKGKEKEGS